MSRKNKKNPLTIGVLASGNGTVLQAIIDAYKSRDLNGKILFVISNNSKSIAGERAKKHNIPFFHLSSVTHSDPQKLDQAMSKIIKDNNVNIVFLAGYMKKIGPITLSDHKGKIINTHPALLPKFGGDGMYGMNVHKTVLESKETESGATVHLVDADYDTGKILAQIRVPVFADDAPEKLCERVMKAEKKQIIDVLLKISTGEIKL
ncbi:MAG: phosphoribosylglycinamide formyltransferase 1 [Candidatus Berkelbacteria bacterium Athens1014_28]|uniref:Phosphoribosylglycinamide formyltransferase n=1 Tax=Candidatus Berkelbacteria bacterium Athens1014_28 TaxID=2017145 RepID=A0A554LL04_9BACT|nr:MAG: phosphoribosylglycinamide formyltransferase 1 [Candidatus Berkelbacteria bacterium Athens1014_28]